MQILKGKHVLRLFALLADGCKLILTYSRVSNNWGGWNKRVVGRFLCD